MPELNIPIHPILIFIVVLARVGGMVTFAPFWSHKAVSVQIRIVLAMILALALTPILSSRLPTPPSNLLPLASVIVLELLVGAAFGFVGRLVFSGIEMAAQVIGFQMGFSLAGTIDPSTQAQTAALGVLGQMLGLIVLMASNGHHWFLLATMRSFHQIPVGSAHITADVAQLFLRLSADALAVGVALAAPAIVMLLAVELALAIAGRAIPQIQVMVLGFPVKIFAGLWLIGGSLYFMPAAVRSSFAAMETALNRLASLM
ncbi:MAG TPA: flagellar biosynthetic protein FliR [Pyrinomonadaceae bacterium]